MIFKNWLDTRPKMETHDPNAYPTILGSVLQGFWTPFLDWGAQSFLARENGHFWRFFRDTLMIIIVLNRLPFWLKQLLPMRPNSQFIIIH